MLILAGIYGIALVATIGIAVFVPFPFVLAPIAAEIALLAAITYAGIVIVPQPYRFVVQLFGDFWEILYPGLNWIPPIIAKVAYQRSTAEQYSDIEAQRTLTKDDIQITIKSRYYYQIGESSEAIRASVYKIELVGNELGHLPLERALDGLLESILRNISGEKTFDEMLDQQEQINQQVRNQAQAATREWGVEVKRHVIEEIIPPTGIIEALQKKLTAEKQAAANIAIAEGDKKAAIARAEGDKQVQVLEAKGLERLAKAAGGAEQAIQFRLAERLIDKGSEAMGKTNANTFVPIPSNILDAVSSFLGKGTRNTPH